MTTIWRMLFGKKNIEVPEISKFVEARDHLVTFRFLSGIPARTIAQAKNLLQWSSIHDEDLSDIKGCGIYFDIENCRLREEKIPGTASHIGSLLIAVLAAILFLISSFGTVLDRAILQFKDSKTWLTLSATTAVPLSGKGHVTLETCTRPVESSFTSFSKEETAYICKKLNDPELRGYVKQMVFEQRVFAVTWAFCFGIGTLMFWSAFRQIESAKNMKKRLSKHVPESENTAHQENYS